MKCKINKERGWMYFVLIPFFPLKGIMEFSLKFKAFMTGWLWIAVFLIVIKLFSFSRKKGFRIDRNSMNVITYFLLMFFITIYVRNGVGEGLQKMIAAPFLCLFILMNTKQKRKSLLDVLANIILFDVFINCTFLCPPIFRKISGGTTDLICSIGHVQTASQIGLIGLLLGVMLKNKGKAGRNKMLILFSILTMIISFTFVSEVVLLFLLFCFLLKKQLTPILKNIKLSNVYIIMLFLNVIIVVGVVIFKIDFAARLGIYTVALSKIVEKPFLGYGVEGIKIIPEWMQWNKNAMGFNYAHNEILQLLLDGGIVLLIANILLVKMILNNVEKSICSQNKYLFAVILISFLVVAISESVTEYFYFWTFIFILLYSKEILEESNEEILE